MIIFEQQLLFRSKVATQNFPRTLNVLLDSPNVVVDRKLLRAFIFNRSFDVHVLAPSDDFIAALVTALTKVADPSVHLGFTDVKQVLKLIEQDIKRDNTGAPAEQLVHPNKLKMLKIVLLASGVDMADEQHVMPTLDSASSNYERTAASMQKIFSDCVTDVSHLKAAFAQGYNRIMMTFAQLGNSQLPASGRQNMSKSVTLPAAFEVFGQRHLMSHILSFDKIFLGLSPSLVLNARFQSSQTAETNHDGDQQDAD